MDQVIKLGALAASAALLQACGSGDGTEATTETPVYNGGLHRTAAQMLYLSNTYQVSDLYQETAQSVTNFDDLPYEESRYSVNSNAPVQYFLLRMLINGRSTERPFSKEYFNHWVTYQLANSFVVALGDELTTVGSALSHSHLSNIRMAVENDTNIKTYMEDYFLHDFFWARFRSPEDNGREVLEIYLGDFRDEVVPKVATILKNYGFDENQGRLRVDISKRNTVAQDIDGTMLTTPEQLYHYVVNHAQFMPHIYKHCVKALYGYEDSAVINAMQIKGLSTFRAIYLEALTHPNIAKVKRAKFPEEVLFPMVKAFDADLHSGDISGIVNRSSQVGAKPMYSKLERRAPDWNTLNTAVLSELVDPRITRESWSSESWSYGIAPAEFRKLYAYTANPSQLLTHLHEKIWGQKQVTYPTAFSTLISDSSLNDYEKLKRALKIVAMNYSFYTYPQESQA